MSELVRMRQLLDKKESARWNINPHFGFVVLIVMLLLFVRFTTLEPHTLSYDEATLANIGFDALQAEEGLAPSDQVPGTTLFPLLLGMATQYLGEQGIRILVILLNLMTIVAVYLNSREWFGNDTALWALVLFGLSGASLNLAHFGVLDAASMPLLAFGLYFLITSTRTNYATKMANLVYAGIFCALAVLINYLNALYLPAVMLLGVIAYLRNREPLDPLITVFATIIVIITGTYLIVYADQMVPFLQHYASFNSTADRDVIARSLFLDSWPILPLAIAGGLIVIYRTVARKTLSVPILVFSLLAAIASFAIPIYLLLVGNTYHLWIYILYGLLLAAPLAGFALHRMRHSINGLESEHMNLLVRLLGIGLVLVIFGILIRQSLNVNWGMRHSWPDVSGIVNYFEAQPMEARSRILAEGDEIFRYYLDRNLANQLAWNNTFGFGYAELEDTAAMSQAIQDHYFDYVILTEYFTPEKSQELRAALKQANYTLVYRDSPQTLSTGRVVQIEVYRSLVLDN